MSAEEDAQQHESDRSEDGRVTAEEGEHTPAWKETKLDSLDGLAEETKTLEKSRNIFAVLAHKDESKRQKMLGTDEDFIRFDQLDGEKPEVGGTEDLEEGEELDVPDAHAMPPWIRSENVKCAIKHSMNKMTTLHYEILDFCRFVTPTKAEHQQRLRLVERVEEAIKKLWPSSRPVVFGSFATGLYLPASDIDISVLDCPNQGGAEERQKLAEELRSIPNFLRKIQVIDKARVPLVKLVDRESNVQCDISFSGMSGPNNVGLIRRYIEDFPALKPLLMVVKCFLQQRNLSEVFRGGLGSYALLLLMVSHLQMHQFNFERPPSSLGEMLLDFFELYGEKFNYCFTGISIRDGGSYYRKFKKYGTDAYQPMLFSIEDPQDESNEIARNSYAALTIRKAFSNALQLLERWRPDEATSEHPSPLSAILHVDELIWSRRNFIVTEDELPDVQMAQHQREKEASALHREGEDSPGNGGSEDKYEPQPLYAYVPSAIPAEQYGPQSDEKYDPLAPMVQDGGDSKTQAVGSNAGYTPQSAAGAYSASQPMDAAANFTQGAFRNGSAGDYTTLLPNTGAAQADGQLRLEERQALNFLASLVSAGASQPLAQAATPAQPVQHAGGFQVPLPPNAVGPAAPMAPYVPSYVPSGPPAQVAPSAQAASSQAPQQHAPGASQENAAVDLASAVKAFQDLVNQRQYNG